MTVVIDLFEVPAHEDEAFLAAWEHARLAGATLHRALRADVRFRFVSMAPGDAAGDLARPALYEVVHQDGAPDGAGGVVLINPFAVPAEADDEFLAGWHRARHALSGQHGYLGTRLHRSFTPTEFRFVNVVRWSSPLMFARAVERPEFREAAGAMAFSSHPALYQRLG